MHSIRNFTCSCLLLALASLTHAQPVHANAPATAHPRALVAELTQQLVTIEKGKEVLKPVTAVKPGDLIEYRVVYTNRSASPVTDVIAELPIPEGLEYQPRTATPRQGHQAATTDGVFGAEPLTQGVAGNKQMIPYSEYRRLRWSLGPIATGAKSQVSARARVSSGTQAMPEKPAAPTGVPESVSTAKGS